MGPKERKSIMFSVRKSIELARQSIEGLFSSQVSTTADHSDPESSSENLEFHSVASRFSQFKSNASNSRVQVDKAPAARRSFRVPSIILERISVCSVRRSS